MFSSISFRNIDEGYIRVVYKETCDDNEESIFFQIINCIYLQENRNIKIVSLPLFIFLFFIMALVFVSIFYFIICFLLKKDC